MVQVKIYAFRSETLSLLTLQAGAKQDKENKK
jgi:hypothetical protein